MEIEPSGSSRGGLKTCSEEGTILWQAQDRLYRALRVTSGSFVRRSRVKWGAAMPAAGNADSLREAFSCGEASGRGMLPSARVGKKNLTPKA
jgi:hypothetical protein